MKPVRFIIAPHTRKFYAGLHQFITTQHLREQVQIEQVDWQQLLPFMESQRHQTGVVVAESGTTWLKYLQQEALIQPFSLTPSGPSTWSARWIWDTRLLFYRRDHLRACGLDPADTFASLEQFRQTLSTLQAAGYRTPLALTTDATLQGMHYMSTWLWATGSDWLNADATQVIFHEPAALAGIQAFYHLLPFMLDPGIPSSDHDQLMRFLEGHSSIFLSGRWGQRALDHRQAGVARLPGAAFVGGTELVMLNTESDTSEAAEIAQRLIQSLTAPGTSRTFAELAHMLPVHPEDQEAPWILDNPLSGVMQDAIATGRSFVPSSLWPIIEQPLPRVYSETWREIAQDPDHIDDIVVQNYTRAAETIQHMIEASIPH
ncbi:MAG: extracellular solute-binding protein [Anaerolineae bacterium]|nr:extracellular solute-binding protein [Anaerolineae bacterium]